jgi:hypothetical protein
MITLWCELAWLGGERAAQGVVIEVVDDRIHSVTPGATTRLTGASV